MLGMVLADVWGASRKPVLHVSASKAASFDSPIGQYTVHSACSMCALANDKQHDS